MAEKIPYLTKVNAIKDFLAKAQSTGVPPKVTQDYLKTIGFTSSSDRPLIPLFVYLGFLTSDGTPTDVYRAYRDKKRAPKVLAKAIKSAYGGLYATYPDANGQDNEALANYLRPTTGLGETAVGAMVGTFKMLCSLADFSDLEEVEEPEEKEEGKKPRVRTRDLSYDAPSLTINLQLTLPATDNEAIYDKLFASLRKNLLEPPEK